MEKLKLKITLIFLCTVNSFLNGESKQNQLQTLTSNLQSLSNIKVKTKKPAQKKPKKPLEQFDFTETVVSIGGVVKKFDKSTPCNIEEWANKLENACKCCLIKNAPLLNQGKKPSEVLKMCLDKDTCNKSIIKAMYKKEKIPHEDKEQRLGDLISHIYNKSILVREVFPHDTKFDQYGHLTEAGAIKLLAQAYKENKLKDEHFKEASCLTAKNVLESLKGFQTLQLFIIKSKCLPEESEFILKEMKSRTKEIISLEKSSSISAIRPYIYPKIVPGFPTFIFPIAFFSYTYNGQSHYLSLMPKAPGILFKNIIKEKMVDDKVKIIYRKTGEAIANFHKKFMNKFKNLAQPGKVLNPTYVQGDLHQGNIFWSDDGNHVFLIDNEKMRGYSPRVPFIDFEMFTLASEAYYFYKYDKKLLDKWLFLTIRSFLKGYIEVYDPQDRRKVLEELIAFFDNKENYAKKDLYDNVYLYRKSLYDRIFYELRNTYHQ